MSENRAETPASVPDPLADALTVPFVPGPKDECVHGGCTADLDGLPVIDDHEFIDRLNDWQGEP